MRAALIAALLSSLAGAGSALEHPQSQSPTDHAGWWIRTYGLVDPETSAIARRARKVFDRLAAAADKRANRMPRLVVVRTDGSPFAMALGDGAVLLTLGGLRICFDGVPERTGNARLAFVLGHELAHLSNDHFWHAAAFSALTEHGGDSDVRETLGPLFERSPEEVRRLELQADAIGMLYMTTAGYDPRAVLRERDFFTEWARQMDSLGFGPSEAHPGPRERAGFLASQMAAVTDEIDLHDFGVMLFQLGRFEDAIVLLERFADRFPSVEVLNNIGLGHFQLAAWFLSRCDERLVVRFKLPTVLDPETRARRLRSFERSPSHCLRNERFRHHYEEAERRLQQAAEKSPDYLPARMNLISLFLLGQEGAKALAASQRAGEARPDDPAILAARAAAMYLVEEETDLRMADAAIEELQRLREKFPRAADPAYNLGAILAERQRVESAKRVWQAFLELEPDGVYSDAVRDYLGKAAPSKTVESGPTLLPRPPVSLGAMSYAEIADRFPEVEKKDIEIGDFRASVVRSADWRALAIDSVIELVEEDIAPSLTEREARSRFGRPLRRQATSSGAILFYPSFAVIVTRDVARALWFFGETRIR